MRPLLVLLVLLTLPVFAQSPNNEIAVAYGSTSYSEDVGDVARHNTATLSYNRFWTPSISTRLGFTQFGADLAIDLGAGETDITATTLTAEYHHARGGFFSPFAGAGAAYIGAEVDTRGFTGRADAELAPMAIAGADFTVARWLALAVEATYISWEPEFSNGCTVDVSPLTVSGAVKFRF